MRYYNLKKVILFLLLSLIHVALTWGDILDAKKYYEFSDYNNCLIELKKILKFNKTSVEAYKLYQNVMLEQDNFPALLKEFEKKVKNNPDDYLSNYLYGNLLIRDPYSEDFAEIYLRKAIEINPKFPWSYLPLARISKNKRSIDESIYILEECIRKWNDFVPAYLTLVYYYQMSYGVEKAIIILEEFLKRVPSDLNLNLMLVDLYCKKNETRKAELLIKTIRKIYRNDYRYHRIIYAWAMCTNSNKIKKELLEFYWNNYPDTPRILSVYNNLFNIYKSDNFSKALRFTRNAINYKTKIIKLKSNAYKNLIEFYKNRDSEEIIKMGQEVINSNLSNPNILIQLGKLILESGEAELALTLFKKANNSCKWNYFKNDVFMGPLIRIEDKNNLISFYLNRSYFYLGKAHYAIGEFKEALEYYRKIVELDNNNFMEEVQTDIARCYISLNDNSEAMRILLNSYQKFSSPKLLDFLKKVYAKKYGSLDRFTSYLTNSSNFENKYENVNSIGFFSNYKGKILIFILQRSSCYACNKIIEVLAKLEKNFGNSNKIAFINLYEQNAPKLNLESIKENRDLYIKVTKKFNFSIVPITLIIDKEGNIRFRIVGFENNENSFADFKARIEILLKEKR